MKTLNLILALAVSAQMLFAQQPVQTPEQIHQQKDLANQAVIAGVADQFKTPLRTFETYFGGITRLDASNYLCVTSNGIKAIFEADTLTPDDLTSIRTGHQERDEKEHVLVEFRYTADQNRPQIIFGYRYNYRDKDGQRITTTEREKLTLTRTPEGWKIDAIESEPAS